MKFDEEALYLCRDGKMIKLDSPESGFGETIVKWQDNKAILLVSKKTLQLK